jgi:hypothetical protein
MAAKTKNGHPPKECGQCGLMFEWRKKWERDWESVRFWQPNHRNTVTDKLGNRYESSVRP